MVNNPILFFGDCLGELKNLESNSVDCVIIDPPYSGNSSRGKVDSKGRFKNSLTIYNDLTERSFYMIMKPIFLECFRLLKENSHFYCFTDWKQIRNMMDCVETGSLKIINLVCWDKTHFGMGAGYRRQEEYIIVASKGHPKKFNLTNVSSIIKVKRITQKSRLHPHEKPQELLDIFIRNSTSEGETILDCFMGSGAIGLCCKTLNRKFIGIEIDENYYQVAVKRIEDG